MNRRLRRSATPAPASPSTGPAASPAAGPSADDVAALQTMLAAEHAAVYVYAVLGARTSASTAPTLFEAIRAAYVEHRDRRDQQIGMIAAAGAEPVGSAPAYAVPGGPGVDLSTPAAVTTVAVALEGGCATTYATGVGSSTGTTRGRAIGWLQTTAVRELVFRGTPEMFPGAEEHADR